MTRTAKRRGAKLARAQIAEANLSRGGRPRIDVSEREAINASRLHRPLGGVVEAVNAQMQTPEAWESVWAEELKGRGVRR